MSGVQRIKDKILLEAETNARDRLEAARAEAGAIVADAERQRALAERDADNRIEIGKSGQLRRNDATLHSEERKQSLAIRQQLVEEAFAKASSALLTLPDARYAELLAAMLLEAGWRGNAELVVSKSDQTRLGAAWLTELDARRAAAGLDGMTAFSADNLPDQGGFVVRVGDVEINGTLPVILSGIRPALEQNVVKALFD